MSELRVEPYAPVFHEQWDARVKAWGLPFLFERAYMDYHADRFPDRSTVVWNGATAVALFPATAYGATVSSHQGLTYGGLLHDGLRGRRVGEVLATLVAHYQAAGFDTLDYKVVPQIYASYPSEEDLYWLFRAKGVLTTRSLSSSIPLPTRRPVEESRRSGLRKAKKLGLVPETHRDFAPFWTMLSENLKERYGTAPVHTLEEIEMLQRRFPEAIRLLTVEHEGRCAAGCVLYKSGSVVHVQYIASTHEGRRAGALDLVFVHAIELAASEGVLWFDFGTSTEKGGALLNETLLFQKEGFGARGVVYDAYRLDLATALRELGNALNLAPQS